MLVKILVKILVNLFDHFFVESFGLNFGQNFGQYFGRIFGLKLVRISIIFLKIWVGIFGCGRVCPRGDVAWGVLGVVGRRRKREFVLISSYHSKAVPPSPELAVTDLFFALV